MSSAEISVASFLRIFVRISLTSRLGVGVGNSNQVRSSSATSRFVGRALGSRKVIRSMRRSSARS